MSPPVLPVFLSLQLYGRHREYLNSLVGTDFEMVSIWLQEYNKLESALYDGLSRLALSALVLQK